MSEQTLEVRNLTKFFQDAHRRLVIVENLNYRFETGASTAIVGRSGVGKSTLLHLLGGLDSPNQGEICLGEVNFGSLSGDRLARFRGTHIGFVFQFHHLLGEFSARENVALPLIIAGERRLEALEKADHCLSMVGLNKRAEHLPGQLSGGEQQRVAIARAVIARPKLFLADEPTGNLDYSTASEVAEVLATVQRETASTMIVVTHSRDFAGRMDYTVEMLPGGDLKEVSG